MIAAREGQLDFIRKLNELYGRQEKKQICKLALDISSSDGWTAFHYAAINGFTTLVEFLAKVPKVEVHAVDRFKRNACHWATRFNNERMVQKLIDLDLDILKHDIEGQNCKSLAQSYQCLESLKVIMNQELNRLKAKKAERESKLN